MLYYAQEVALWFVAFVLVVLVPAYLKHLSLQDPIYTGKRGYGVGKGVKIKKFSHSDPKTSEITGLEPLILG